MRTPSLIALLATAAAGAGGGKLLAVRAVPGPDSTLVQLEADQPLSFTTLKLAAPPRVVIDLADTAVAGVPAEQEVGDGAVRRIAAAGAGAHTARVIIELAADVEFDVRASGTRIEVRVPRAAALARNRQAESGGETAGAGANATATPAAIPTPTSAATETVAVTASEPAPTEPAKATEPAAMATTVSEAAPANAIPTATPAAAAPPAVAAPVATIPETPTPASGPAPSTEVTSPAVAAKVQAVAPAASPAPAQIPEVRERAALPTVALVGSQRPAAPEERPPATPKHAVLPPPAKGHAAITGIGFRPQSGGEVIVRSDRPLRYGVSSLERAVLLHLPDAAIPLANNRRPLDTRVFGGTVQRIVPLQHSGGTEVRIELREPAEVHLNQSGSLLTLSFTPGS